MKHTKASVISSLFWRLMERGGSQGIQFIVQIILARLLLPEDYGVIAIVTIFIALSNTFVQSGFNTALIQKKDADKTDFSSVFYVSMSITAVLYAILFVTSPLIAKFYNMPELTAVLRVLAVSLFFGAYNSIQIAYISRNMMFKMLFFSSLGAFIVSGIAGVVAAYRGYGVWALVTYQLTSQVAVTVILWFIVKWRPAPLFSFKRVKELFSFGWKILVSSLLNTLYLEVRSLIIGKIYTPAMLGFYNRGKQFPSLIVDNIDGSIQSVMLPALSAHQNDALRVKEMVRRSVMTSSFIVFPLMAGLAVVAEPVIRIVLTDKWLPAVPFMQIFCITYALRPIHTANLQAINALGRSDIFLKLEIIKKIIGIVILLISIPFGIYAIALGVLINGIISAFVNAYPSKTLFDYSYAEQLKDLLPASLLSVFMGAAVFMLGMLKLSVWLTLTIQVASGVLLYFGASTLYKIDSFLYLTQTFREILSGRRGRDS